MPVVRIDMYKGRSAAEKKMILDAVHDALVEALGIPDDDRTQMINEYDPEHFERKTGRSEAFLMIEISLFAGRPREVKKRLYGLITGKLSTAAGIAPSDVMICYNEQPRENWGINGLPADEIDFGYRIER